MFYEGLYERDHISIQVEMMWLECETLLERSFNNLIYSNDYRQTSSLNWSHILWIDENLRYAEAYSHVYGVEVQSCL